VRRVVDLLGRTDLGAENHGVKPFDFPLLTDENVGPEVVAGLRERGCDVRTVADEDIIGAADKDVLHRAVKYDRVVVTHDLDVEPPFVLVADRRETAVRVRVRSGPPW
jgi:predicted nuclease of predicted toxin-antitoxin system